MRRHLKVERGILLITLLFAFAGCFQYPEGPVFTVQTREERINGTWRLTSATDSLGQDVTAQEPYKDVTLTAIASRGGDNTWSMFQYGNLTSQGLFSFAEHGDELIVVFSFYQGLDTDTQLFYDIRRLTNKYFYFVDQYGFTFHFQKY